MIPPAVLTLLRLHFRGTIRRLLRGARTPRGLAFMVLGLVVFFAWLVPRLVIAMKFKRVDVELVRTTAPFAILGFCLANMLTSVGENAVAFTAAEVDFLFPGPFTRRTLLGYKILKTALGTTFTTVVFSILMLRYSPSWISCFVGIWVTIQFMQLFAMAVMMIGQTIGERVYGTTKRAVVIVVLAVAAIALAPKVSAGLQMAPVELMRQVHMSLAGRILLAPFDIFVRTMTAQSIVPELLMWGSMALGINVLMLMVVIGLDANYLETAAMVSQKRYQRLQRLRRGGVGSLADSGRARFRIVPLPWLGGIGPIAWRQMTGVVRSSRSLLLVLVMIGLIAGSLIMRQRGHTDSTMGAVLGVAAWMNVVLISMLRFDFRDELDRLDLLRSLPLRPAAVAAAELITPVLVLTGLQLILCVVVAFSFREMLPYVLIAAMFTIPFNVLLAGIENWLFLMFPLRSAGLIAGDMQLFGRQMVVFLCKFLLLVIGVAFAAVIGSLGYYVGGKSWLGFGMLAWLGLAGAGLLTIPLLAREYTRFDPSVDTPP